MAGSVRGPVPFVCLVCKHKPDSYYGRLVFPEELPPTDDQFNAVAEGGGSISIPTPPLCPNHVKGQEQELIPA